MYTPENTTQLETSHAQVKNGFMIFGLNIQKIVQSTTQERKKKSKPQSPVGMIHVW